MYDYKGLEALTTVIEYQGFDVAAKRLHISQSAVSQRLKSLQKYFNDPLIIRSIPYTPTKLGEYLLGHFKRVQLLELQLKSQLKQKTTQYKFSFAISRDSLETWFMSILKSTDLFKDKIIEIITDDQEITISYLQKGLVNACFTTVEKPIANCSSIFLGHMDYILVCSPAFQKQYFLENTHKHNLLHAPAVMFDKNDKLHELYLEKHFNIKNESPTYHIIPSVIGFKNFALEGYAYALIPEIDVQQELKTKKLVQLYKNKIWKMPLYLHSWNIESKEYSELYRQLIVAIKNRLTC